MSETTNEEITVSIGAVGVNQQEEIADYQKLIAEGNVVNKINRKTSSAMAAQVAEQAGKGEYLGFSYEQGEAILIVESTRSSQASIGGRGSMAQKSMVYRPGMNSGNARSDRNTFIGTCLGNSPVMLAVANTEAVDLGDGEVAEDTSLEYMLIEKDEMILKSISLILGVEAAAEITNAQTEDPTMANAMRIVVKVTNVARAIELSRIQAGLAMGLVGDNTPKNISFSFPDCEVLEITHAHGVSDSKFSGKSKKQILAMAGSSWKNNLALSRQRIGQMAQQNAQSAMAGMMPQVSIEGQPIEQNKVETTETAIEGL